LRKLLIAAAGILAIGFAAFWIITAPASVPASALPPRTPDLENGKVMFYAGGCASCHATTGQRDATRLGGGLALESPFGTFYAPNISPDRDDGIGRWNEADFITALWKGTSPRGQHYYPAFTYTSYQRIVLDDARAFVRLPSRTRRRPPPARRRHH
jgi:mono/diheme cytochrome c family protein